MLNVSIPFVVFTDLQPVALHNTGNLIGCGYKYHEHQHKRKATHILYALNLRNNITWAFLQFEPAFGKTADGH